MSLKYKSAVIFVSVFATIQLGCNKLIEVEAPLTSTNALNVYNTDVTAAGVLTGIYARMSGDGFSSQSIIGISLFAGLSADEFTLFSGVTDNTMLAFYRNSLRDDGPGTGFWNKLYQTIYAANTAIEGISSSTSLTANVASQLLGEAKFIRAFCYYYLVNLYGEVPLVLTSDVNTNATLQKSSISNVYQQIIADLKEAKDLLNANYVFNNASTITNERTRPNKSTASSLLSRTYLFIQDWANAEKEASLIVNNKTLYDTVSIDNVFLKNSKEAIWQLQPVLSGQNTQDARLFVLPVTGPSNSTANPVYMPGILLNSFEADDQRKKKWVSSVTANSVTYSFPFKYRVNVFNAAVSEYLMVFRLAEQFLIRAEAAARQNNLTEAVNDLNVIRKRAGLSLLPTSLSQKQILDTVMQERKSELFSEWGHRWFDLKRTGTINSVMTAVASQKGSSWNPDWALYPVPRIDVQRNPNMVQNNGY